MASQKLICSGCLKSINANDFLRCITCTKPFDLMCASISEQRFRNLSKDFKASWICHGCKSKRPKGDNSNTPIRSNQSSLDTARGEFSPETNITLRKKPNTHSMSPSTSETCPGIDPILVETIKCLIQTAVDNSVQSAVKSALEKEFQVYKPDLAILEQFRKTLEFISADYDRIKCELKESNDKITILTKENKNLTKTITDLSTRVNLIEQYSRENNIEINGIPENKSENLCNVLKQISAVVSAPIQDSDIQNCTRVRKLDETSKRPRSVIVKLPNVRVRDNFIAAVSQYNKKNPSEKLHSGLLGYGGNKSPIFVAEHLSPFYKALHAETRKNAREKGYRYIWVRNGHIFCRKDDYSPAKQVKSYESLKFI